MAIITATCVPTRLRAVNLQPAIASRRQPTFGVFLRSKYSFTERISNLGKWFLAYVVMSVANAKKMNKK